MTGDAPQGLVVATRENMIAEAKGIVDAARERGLVLRLLGGLATRLYCRSLDFCERDHGDIDLIGHRRDAGRIEQLFTDLGYQADRHVQFATDGRQLRFTRQCRHGDEWSRYRPHEEDHADVFLDTFKLEHAVDLRERLELDDYAVTPTDQLLIKLQMAQLEEKDERDVFTLLRDLQSGAAAGEAGEAGDPTGNEAAAVARSADRPALDFGHIARLCAHDWGLYHDVLSNLGRLQERLGSYEVEATAEGRVRAALAGLEQAIEAQPKSSAWRLRAKIGTRLPWRNVVEEQDGDQQGEY